MIISELIENSRFLDVPATADVVWCCCCYFCTSTGQ
ncbi:Uncharacterised protein [Streptococcus pseudopneumoniae]|nr:Uncharacterised protein [Streptococcus pseudopneumoniae]COC67988.1 Uncharacterised protein [Streptococcus pseudopneumoniae]CON44886.1 Uncharacterised protein [Streptococcus pseudopneumoniae]